MHAAPGARLLKYSVGSGMAKSGVSADLKVVPVLERLLPCERAYLYAGFVHSMRNRPVPYNLNSNCDQSLYRAISLTAKMLSISK
jgi:hypothetical protein